ncbi:MAG: hypothetical protein JW795_03095 [Chitinivibrionales bacterium]|nr:hypothetical protein [Chitinivibrionales bacterium]
MSASGQTSLYTGINVPKLQGRHSDSFPTASMRKILYEKNLLSQLNKSAIDAVFLNTYPIFGHYFNEDHIELSSSGELIFSTEFPSRYRRRISATTCMMLAARQRPFNEVDCAAGQALYQDFSNKLLREKIPDIPLRSPRQAAEILAHALRRHDFVLYEYFQTDLFGHRNTALEQDVLIRDLDLLMGELISMLDPARDTLLLTSDHGNLEDGSVQTHTLNPVPLIVWGNEAEVVRNRITSLTDVTPAIIQFFSVKNG